MIGVASAHARPTVRRSLSILLLLYGILGSCSCLGAAAAEGQTRVAFLGWLPGEPDAKPLPEWLDDLAVLVEAELLGERRLALVERRELDKALKETELTLGRLTSAEGSIRIGRLTGAEILVY